MQHNITLIEVPFWWDRTVESSAATIHNARSDPIPSSPGAQPIPMQLPSDVVSKHSNFVAPLSHGYSWDGITNVEGW